MKKKIVLAVSAIVAACGMLAQTLMANDAAEQSLAKANIAALMDASPKSVQQTCTRIKESAGCYNEAGYWVCQRVVSVEEYQSNSASECRHDVVTFCPPGTFEKHKE